MIISINQNQYDITDSQQYRLTFWNRFSSEQRQSSDPEEESVKTLTASGPEKELNLYGSIGEGDNAGQPTTTGETAIGYDSSANIEEGRASCSLQ